jgi:Asparaginase, N-terminal
MICGTGKKMSTVFTLEMMWFSKSILVKKKCKYLTLLRLIILIFIADGVDNIYWSLVLAGTSNIPSVGIFFHYKLMQANRAAKVKLLTIFAFIPDLI